MLLLFPFLAIFGYVNYPKDLRINASLLYSFSVIHNALLVGFSAWTCCSLLFILHDKGIVFQHNYYFQDAAFDKIIFYFYLSKYYEFFDTFLLYLNGKTPLFLQKYHHIGAVLSWHLMWVYKVDVVWMASLLNSFVHTIMYSYYLGCLLKINQIRFIKQYITSLQLVQFFILYSNFYFYLPPVETWINFYVIIFFAAYGLGVIYLFGAFYYNNYICKKLK
jgi:hypothetical protein